MEDKYPFWNLDVTQHESNDSIKIFSKTSGKTLTLDSPARAVWNLCDGRRSVAEIAQELGRLLGRPGEELRGDVTRAVTQFHELGFLVLDGTRRESKERYGIFPSSKGTWDWLARDYDQIREKDTTYMACVHAAAGAIRPNPRATVLDCGCGTGMVTQKMVSHFGRIVALDFSRHSLELLQQRSGSKGLLLVQADIRRLPFADGAFDAVVCANTLQHLHPGRDQKAGADELVRVTKPGGKVAATVHHYGRSKRRKGWSKQGRSGGHGGDYLFRFLPSELAALLPGARISSVGFDLPLWRFPKIRLLLQNVTTMLFGRILAFCGSGHMLLATLSCRDSVRREPVSPRVDVTDAAERQGVGRVPGVALGSRRV